MFRKEVTWKGYLKGKIKYKKDKITSVKRVIFIEKNNIFEPNNICLIISKIILNLIFALIFFKSMAHINILLFSVLSNVYLLSKRVYSIEYKPLGGWGTSIIKFVIYFSKGIEKGSAFCSNILSYIFNKIFWNNLI